MVMTKSRSTVGRRNAQRIQSLCCTTPSAVPRATAGAASACSFGTVLTVYPSLPFADSFAPIPLSRLDRERGQVRGSTAAFPGNHRATEILVVIPGIPHHVFDRLAGFLERLLRRFRACCHVCDLGAEHFVELTRLRDWLHAVRGWETLGQSCEIRLDRLELGEQREPRRLPEVLDPLLANFLGTTELDPLPGPVLVL